MSTAVANLIVALLLLVPCQCVTLPFNMAPADILGLLLLPVCWTWLAHERHPLRLSYVTPTALLLVATAAACLGSLDPTASVGALVKEVYLFTLFFTLGSALTALPPQLSRRILGAWLLAGLGNGALVLAQFATPQLLAAMNRALAGIGGLDPFRPSGLFENSNTAALFQVSVFVPLLSLQWRPAITAALAAVLLAMLAGTGSMGALLALGVGLLTLLSGLVARRRWSTALRLTGALAFLAAALGLLLVAAVPSLHERVEYVLTGRSSYSAESRFLIWTRGIQALLADGALLGVGPDMWRRIDGHELHNDLLAFAVERGPFAVIALLLFAGAVLRRCVLLAGHIAARQLLALLAVPAALAAVATMSQTHEVLHQRPLWLVLALLEGHWWRAQAHAGLVGAPPPPAAPAVPPGSPPPLPAVSAAPP